VALCYAAEFTLNLGYYSRATMIVHEHDKLSMCCIIRENVNILKMLKYKKQ
jgi:hypothetical protein